MSQILQLQRGSFAVYRMHTLNKKADYQGHPLSLCNENQAIDYLRNFSKNNGNKKPIVEKDENAMDSTRLDLTNEGVAAMKKIAKKDRKENLK